MDCDKILDRPPETKNPEIIRVLQVLSDRKKVFPELVAPPEVPAKIEDSKLDLFLILTSSTAKQILSSIF